MSANFSSSTRCYEQDERAAGAKVETQKPFSYHLRNLLTKLEIRLPQSLSVFTSSHTDDGLCWNWQAVSSRCAFLSLREATPFYKPSEINFLARWPPGRTYFLSTKALLVATKISLCRTFVEYQRTISFVHLAFSVSVLLRSTPIGLQRLCAIIIRPIQSSWCVYPDDNQGPPAPMERLCGDTWNLTPHRTTTLVQIALAFFHFSTLLTFKTDGTLKNLVTIVTNQNFDNPGIINYFRRPWPPTGCYQPFARYLHLVWQEMKYQSNLPSEPNSIVTHSVQALITYHDPRFWRYISAKAPLGRLTQLQHLQRYQAQLMLPTVNL